MKLFFGLGNPGKEYENTRHNLGQMIIKKYVETPRGASLLNKSKLQSKLCEIDNNIFATSTQYMNLSGSSVQKVAAFYKISPQNIYLIHDDLDLPIGEWRLQFDRGPAGHNGVKSTIENLGTQAFWRIRIGIGHPENNLPVEDYVLKPFTVDEKKQISALIDTITGEIENLGH